MAKTAGRFAPIAALLGSLVFSLPAQAETGDEQILQELRRLNERMAQLEADNARLKGELAASRGAAAREREIVGRLEDVERQVGSHDRKTRLLDAVEGVSASASLVMVGQTALSGTLGGKDESRLNYRADAEIELPAGSIGDARGELYAHFRMGQGNGLGFMPPTLTSTTNSTAFALSNGDETAVMLAQAWYELEMPVGESELELYVGKIDPFGHFDQNDIADDESAAFLNNVFVHNPLLDSGGDIDVDAYGFAPGMILSWRDNSRSPDYWKASVGLFSSGQGGSWDSDLSRPFIIGQLEAGSDGLFGREGVYRLYAWSRGRATPYANEFDAGTEKHSGWGLSANQQVAEHVTVFGRYAHSLEGKMRFDKALTLGAEIGGARWGREDDRIGLAAGWADTTKAFRAAAPVLDADSDGVADFGYAPDGAEQQYEIYYAWKANDHLELSPDFQWIRNPGGDSSRADIAVIGLRATVSY
ncbi:MAG: carbohydrate porin [Pseudomonadota bacterium]